MRGAGIMICDEAAGAVALGGSHVGISSRGGGGARASSGGDGEQRVVGRHLGLLPTTWGPSHAARPGVTCLSYS